jgi:hypothetical protein
MEDLVIVEDDHGNNVYLSDLDDHREPEPPEPEDESLTLEEIEELFARCTRDDTHTLREEDQLLAVAIPQMLAELRHWRSLDTRNEYTITDGTASAHDARLIPEQQADFVLAHPETLKHAWVRTVHLGPWVQLSNKPPF